MDTFLEALSTKNARTANGAITNSTSLNTCLDFFSEKEMSYTNRRSDYYIYLYYSFIFCFKYIST